MLLFIFVIAAASLIVWAFYLHRNAKPGDPNVFKKIALSVAAAIASVAAAVATFFGSGVTP